MDLDIDITDTGMKYTVLWYHTHKWADHQLKLRERKHSLNKSIQENHGLFEQGEPTKDVWTHPNKSGWTTSYT